MRPRPLLSVLFLLLSGLCQAATITADEAKNHIGENATVCGQVAGVHTATSSNGSPTFVNLDKASRGGAA